MARKKPEVVQALESVKPRCAELGCDAHAIVRFERRDLCEQHYVAASTRGASEAMERAGLTRRSGESTFDWRKRVLGWLRANVRRIQQDQDATA